MASTELSKNSAVGNPTIRDARYSSWVLPVFGLCGMLLLGEIGTVSDANAGPNATAPCAIGDDVETTQCGVGASATAERSTAVGDDALATGAQQSTAVGHRAHATANHATAIGQSSDANAVETTAVGQDSKASKPGATAIGVGSRALHTDSTAIGIGAVTTAHDQIVLGTASTEVYTLPGLLSGAASSVVTVDSSGNLTHDGGAIKSDITTNAGGVTTNAGGISTNAGAISTNAGGITTNAGGISTNASGITTNASGISTNTSAITTNAGGISTNAGAITTNASGISTNAAGIATNAVDITALDSRVGTNETDIATLRTSLGDGLARNGRRIDEATEGVAMALALDNPDLFGGQTFAMRLGYGTFEGENALGFSAAGMLGRNLLGSGETWRVSAGVGFGLDHDTVGGKAGVQIGW